MLDEPFAGIDPVTVQGVQGVIRALADSGISVLITDHAAREILQITDRTYVVSEGRILCSGTAEQIVAHPEVRKKYLGDIEMPATAAEPGANASRLANASGLAKELPGELADRPVHSAPSPHLKFSSPVDPAVEASASKLESQNVAVRNANGDANDSSTDQDSANGIPTPASPFPNRPRSRKVVAPFKSTDLDS
jgi:ABC-type multidrug transport system ATPase subunit